MSSTTSTTNRKSSTKAPAKQEAPANPQGGTVLNESVKTGVDATSAAANNQRPRVNLYGYIFTQHKTFMPSVKNEAGEVVKKAVLYMALKTRLQGQEEHKIIDVKVFGAQAEYLNANLPHNIAVVANGYFTKKIDKQGNATDEDIFVCSDNWGITLPVPKLVAAAPVQEPVEEVEGEVEA